MTDFPFDTYSAESYDGGITWTNFINMTTVFNTLADPELYWLNDNTIILFARQTIKKYDCRLVYFLSKDDCKTWSDPVLIYDYSPMPPNDAGYTGFVPFPDMNGGLLVWHAGDKSDCDIYLEWMKNL